MERKSAASVDIPTPMVSSTPSAKKTTSKTAKLPKEHIETIRDYRISFELKNPDPTANPKPQPLSIIKYKDPKLKDSKASSYILQFPNCYISVYNKTDQFGSNVRNAVMTWVKNKFCDIDKLNSFFDKVRDAFVDTLIKSHDQYIDWLKIVTISVNNEVTNVANIIEDAMSDDNKELLDKIKTAIRSKIMSPFSVDNNNSDVLKCYIEMTKYPTENRNGHDEAKFEKMKERGNICRSFFLSGTLKKALGYSTARVMDAEIKAVSVLSKFKGHIPIEKNSFLQDAPVVTDFHMAKGLTIGDQSYSYLIGGDFTMHFYLGKSGTNGQPASIKTKMELTGGTLVSITKTPEFMVSSKKDTREDEVDESYYDDVDETTLGSNLGDNFDDLVVKKPTTDDGENEGEDD